MMPRYLKDFFGFPGFLMEAYDLYDPIFHSIENERLLKILRKFK